MLVGGGGGVRPPIREYDGSLIRPTILKQPLLPSPEGTLQIQHTQKEQRYIIRQRKVLSYSITKMIQFSSVSALHCN